MITEKDAKKMGWSLCITTKRIINNLDNKTMIYEWIRHFKYKNWWKKKWKLEINKNKGKFSHKSSKFFFISAFLVIFFLTVTLSPFLSLSLNSPFFLLFLLRLCLFFVFSFTLQFSSTLNNLPSMARHK